MKNSWGRSLVLVAILGGAAAAAPSETELQGRYAYRFLSPAALATSRGEARLIRTAAGLDLALGSQRLAGKRAGSGTWIYDWTARLGARGALQGGVSLSYVLTLRAQSNRLLVGEVHRDGRLAARIALTRSLGQLEHVGFSAREPNAREGLRSILAGEEWQTGIPTTLFKLRLVPFGGKGLWDLGHLPAPTEAPGRENFGKLPLGLSSFERDGVKVVNTNCFTCHFGVVAGQVIAGLPSTNFDAAGQKLMVDQVVGFYRTPSIKQAIAKRAIDMLLNPAEENQLDRFLDYYQSVIRPSLSAAAGRGQNPGPHVVWRTLARLRKGKTSWSLAKPGELTDLERALLFEPDGSPKQLPPVDPSPWWHLKYKQRSFWLNDVTHLSPATFALNLLDEAPTDWTARLERTQKHLTFARQTKAPRYPGPIDGARADRGHQLFSDKRLGCAVCHGDYSRQGRLRPAHFPNDTYAVGTDPAYGRLVQSFAPLYQQAELLFEHVDERWFALRQGDKRVALPPPVEPKVAYAAPPLVGVWASAPYFHNGSVPTLAGVLDPKLRPAIWSRSDDPFAYDHTQVGLRHRAHTAAAWTRLQAQADPTSLTGRQALRARRVFDTRRPGWGRGGHDFAKLLDPEQLKDLLEYLKRL